MVSDGNGCLYQIALDCIGGVRDPATNCLQPVSSVALGVHAMAMNASASRSRTRVVIGVMVLQSMALMQHVLHCDLDSVREFLARLEEEKSTPLSFFLLLHSVCASLQISIGRIARSSRREWRII